MPSFRYSRPYSIAQKFFGYNDRENVMRIAIEFAMYSHLEGDYLEFGVYEGNSFTSAYHLAQRNRLKDMRFYAFDSFSGLPSVDNKKEAVQFTHGEFACTESKFREVLASRGVDLNKVTTVPGFYDQSLNEETKKELPIRSAAVIWIDCDLYSSTVPVLDFITDYIQDGTVLLFDDYFCFRGRPDEGEQRALSEWLQRNPSISVSEFHKFGWHGNSFIVHKS
tara:strand:+ start:11916 stop:12581 length:666 start_codon:yes stop_codon:yes gene_type:complete